MRTFGEEYAERTRSIRKKNLDTFLPDFFDMDEEKRIKHIFYQQSVDYLIKLKGKLEKHIPNERRRNYYENQIYRRIYDLILR